jgi:hypothetical protein
MNVLERAQKIVRAALNSCKTNSGRSHIDEVQLHVNGYAEPGYSDPESGVIATGNWNDVTEWRNGRSQVVDTAPKRLGELLERLGVELEWSDEWQTCSNCSKLYRTEPDSYSWKRSYVQFEDGDQLCEDCVKHDPTDFLQQLEGNDNSCNTLDLNLEDYGYILLEGDFQHGFHQGQDANPKLIAKALRDMGVKRFVFNLDSTGQFDISFSVYVHEDDMPKVDLEKFNAANKDGPSNSAGLARSLRAVAEQPVADFVTDSEGNLVKPIIHAECDVGNGTAKVRELTPEEFLKGIGKK